MHKTLSLFKKVYRDKNTSLLNKHNTQNLKKITRFVDKNSKYTLEI